MAESRPFIHNYILRSIQKILDQYFDEYSTMSEASHNAVMEIAAREKIEMNSIIVATSLCFDELNHPQGKMNLILSITKLKKKYSHSYNITLRCLAGFPYIFWVAL